MRQHGRANIDARSPRALGVCDRCGALYNLHQLNWQYGWQGPRLQNLRVLVCHSCMDRPNEQLRTIILPPDPQPVMNPRPENYLNANNPMSPIGASPNWNIAALNIWTVSGAPDAAMYGNMAQAGGIQSAFDGNLNKPLSMCAMMAPSDVVNFVGKNWAGDPAGVPTPAELDPPVPTHTLTAVIVTAPNDTPFLAAGATPYIVVASSDFDTWTTLASGTTAGTVGETLTITSFSNNNSYQYHIFSLDGDGVSAAAIAQIQISVGETG